MASSDDDDDYEMLKIYNKSGATLPAKVKLDIKPNVHLLSSSRSTNHQSSSSPNIGRSPVPAGISPATATPSEKYGVRGKQGDVIFRFKCKDSSSWEDDKQRIKSSCKITKLQPTASFDTFNDPFKYMFQKTKNISASMDEVVSNVGNEIMDKLELQKEETNTTSTEPEDEIENDYYSHFRNRLSLNDMSVEQARFIGRIRSDGSRLTTGSIFFEGCLEDSNGHTVIQDLSALEEYHVFPGQITVMEGKNEMGKCLRVTKMIEQEPLPFQNISINKSSMDPILSILIAVGPFTPNDSLKYEPLADLIKVVVRDEPDICILIGPFIDSSHKMIDELGVSFDDLFQGELDKFKNAISNISTTVLLVPSCKDIHGQLVYPTPPFSSNKISNRFIMLPDPATVSINGGLVISMTSTDILMHLSKNELANSTISGDRMGRLARHMLTQRSFYPLYPSEESVPFDAENYVKFGRMEQVRPHILILPSDLRHFIKDVDGSIVVNPERITKGPSGGTFARILIDLSSSSKENDTLKSIADFSVGEIIKI